MLIGPSFTMVDGVSNAHHGVSRKKRDRTRNVGRRRLDTPRVSSTPLGTNSKSSPPAKDDSQASLAAVAGGSANATAPDSATAAQSDTTTPLAADAEEGQITQDIKKQHSGLATESKVDGAT